MNRPVATRSPIALQDAKARFSEVVDAAMRGPAQPVTRRGKPAVVIVAATEYERLTRKDTAREGGNFIEHLLAQPKPSKGSRPVRLSPPELKPRDFDFAP